MPADTYPMTVIVPDLLRMCPFPFSINPLDHITSPASDRWLEGPGTLTTSKQRVAQAGLNAGLIASMSWPKVADRERLQVCADYCNFLFHLDDLTDEMDSKDAKAVREAVMDVMYAPEKWRRKIERGEAHAVSVLMYDLWVRIVKHAGPLVQQRFVHTTDLFFAAITDEAKDRKQKKTPTLTEYVIRRRDNGAVRPCFALIEYANNFQLPEEVWNHPVVRVLDDGANDLICWANDVYSFNIEHARGDTHNIVIVVMREKRLGIQEAMDCVGQLFQLKVQEFLMARAALPSWSPEIDRDVHVYVEGMQSWAIGSAEWCFRTKRYFEDGMKVRETRVMKLDPRAEPV